MIKTLHFFIIIAFLAGIIAPACGFAWGGKYSVIEICTANGIENRIIATAEESQSPNDAPHQQMIDQCQFCFSTSHFELAAFSNSQALKLENKSLQLKIEAYQSLRLSHLTSYEQPRGPPLYV